MKSVSLHVGLLLPIATVAAFVSPSAHTPTSRSRTFVRQDTTTLQRYASVENSVSPESQDVTDDRGIASPRDVFPTAEFLTFELADHRPMGCTVEESLFPDDDYVFVSKVVPGGFAEQAGIQVGDVLFAITGLFEVSTLVLEAGVDKM
jgi:hypothetical protein